MMHKLTGIVALLTLPLLLVACSDVGDAAEAETGEKVAVETTTADVSYVIEPSSSMVNWRAAKVTASHDGGFNDFSGSAEVR